uniref:Uncharacterized protein n=1 Tax=Triticum urartu TaxID=4572 RepID=A0A8R7K0D4_TRIUA
MLCDASFCTPNRLLRKRNKSSCIRVYFGVCIDGRIIVPLLCTNSFIYTVGSSLYKFPDNCRLMLIFFWKE